MVIIRRIIEVFKNSTKLTKCFFSSEDRFMRE
jgi:hypothetical protein